MNNYFNN
jgi:hypothetical protein